MSDHQAGRSRALMRSVCHRPRCAWATAKRHLPALIVAAFGGGLTTTLVACLDFGLGGIGLAGSAGLAAMLCGLFVVIGESFGEDLMNAVLLIALALPTLWFGGGDFAFIYVVVMVAVAIGIVGNRLVRSLPKPSPPAVAPPASADAGTPGT